MLALLMLEKRLLKVVQFDDPKVLIMDSPRWPPLLFLADCPDSYSSHIHPHPQTLAQNTAPALWAPDWDSQVCPGKLQDLVRALQDHHWLELGWPKARGCTGHSTNLGINQNQKQTHSAMQIINSYIIEYNTIVEPQFRKSWDVGQIVNKNRMQGHGNFLNPYFIHNRT